MGTDVLTEHEGTCRSCGAPVYWTETEKGKRMPVDREPGDDGNIVLIVAESLEGSRLIAAYRKKDGVCEWGCVTFLTLRLVRSRRRGEGADR